MAGDAVIENLSNRKLFYILSLLVFAQVVFFLLGGLIAPQPSNTMEFLLSRCFDKSLGMNNKWFYIRPHNGSCTTIPDHNYALKTGDTREIVFVAQMPHPRDGVQLEYSPWFQSLLGLLMVDIEFHDEKWTMRPDPELMLDIRMGYRTHQDRADEWHELVKTMVSRPLECSVDDTMRVNGYYYNCTPIELFELGSNDYPFYLLNIRIPMCNERNGKQNCDIGRLIDLHVVSIHQNGGFTKVWLSMKTFLTPFILFAVVWYWNRISKLPRNPYLIEKAILSLGVTLAFLDFPLEWLSLWLQMPFMLLVSDIRQGIFYAMLFSFWLIFTGEHLIDDSARNKLIHYWKHLAFVLIAMSCLFVFDMCERGVHLKNPFYSIWATNFGSSLAYGFILLAAISACLYFCFLGYYVIRVMGTIKRKRAALHNYNKNRRLKFEGIIYRFQFLMGLTLVCAALTVAGFIMEQVGEGQLRWGDYDDSPAVNTTSAFLTGTFGMWNIYVLLLLAMYAPSHKQYRDAQQIPMEGDDDEDVVLDTDYATESSALTTFIKPATE